MSKLFEELRGQLNQEKGVALATVVRGKEHVGAKLLVFADKRTDGTLGNAELDARVLEDADHAIWHGQAGNVGAIGSRKTSEERSERLKKQGLTDEQLARIHGPIGLNIGATSPEEMALAIMAEIVATRYGKGRPATSDWKK